MSTNFQLLKEMKKRVLASNACVDSLLSVQPDSGRFNNLLEVALQQQETACIEMRRLYEQLRTAEKDIHTRPPDGKFTEVYGEISVMCEGWVHIKLNSLLPHCKVVGGTQYVSDCLLRLLNKASDEIKLPFFNKAFLGIIECCPRDVSDVFDHDNKGFKAVQNVLKGRLFPDDDCFEMSLGLFTEQREESCCHIYVLPDDETGIFTDMRLSGELR